VFKSSTFCWLLGSITKSRDIERGPGKTFSRAHFGALYIFERRRGPRTLRITKGDIIQQHIDTQSV